MKCREEEAAFQRFAARKRGADMLTPSGKPGKPDAKDSKDSMDSMDSMGQLGQLDDVNSNEDELTGEADLAGDEAADLAGEDDFYREMKKRKEAKRSAKEARQQYAARYVNEDFELEEGESRKATQKILKNRGLVPSRPKENRNPRVKKRRRYEQAVKRRKGQVVPMRTNEADQYMGEKSGIRADVTHSRLFN